MEKYQWIQGKGYDIITYDHLWYHQLNFLVSDFVTYAVKLDGLSCEVGDFKMFIEDKIFHTEFTYRHFDVISYAYRRSIREGEVLIDVDFVKEYPQLLQR